MTAGKSATSLMAVLVPGDLLLADCGPYEESRPTSRLVQPADETSEVAYSVSGGLSELDVEISRIEGVVLARLPEDKGVNACRFAGGMIARGLREDGGAYLNDAHREVSLVTPGWRGGRVRGASQPELSPQTTVSASGTIGFRSAD